MSLHCICSVTLYTLIFNDLLSKVYDIVMLVGALVWQLNPRLGQVSHGLCLQSYFHFKDAFSYGLPPATCVCACACVCACVSVFVEKNRENAEQSKGRGLRIEGGGCRRQTVPEAP